MRPWRRRRERSASKNLWRVSLRAVKRTWRSPAEMKAVTLLDRGVEKLRALKDDPKVQAHLYQTLGTVYGSLGKLDQADSLLQEAQGLLKSAYGPDNEEVADNLVHVAMLRIDEARLPEAERLAQEALAIDRRHLPASALGAGEATATLGAVLERRGAYDGAIDALTESVRLLEAARAPEIETLTSRTLLANAHFHLGHYAIADTLNRQILAVDRRRKGERHPDVAVDLIEPGEHSIPMGPLPGVGGLLSAGGWNLRTLATQGPSHDSGYGMLPRTNTDRGGGGMTKRLLWRKGRFVTWSTRILKSLTPAWRWRFCNQVLSPSIAGNCTRRKPTMAEWRRSTGQSMATSTKVRPRRLSHLADAYLDEGQYARAEQMFRDVIRRLSQALPAGHLNIGIARVQLGRTLLREKRYSEAESESLAGYEILQKTTGPAEQMAAVCARVTGCTIYDNLHQAEKAAQFRAEMAAK